MDSVGEDCIETAALGRPFRLGMLYDCRKDSLIPGITLWDHEQLQKNTDVCSQNNTEFNVTTSDSIDDKASALKVAGSLKGSLLGGLVNVSGSAKFFQDTKKSHKQERVTLQYHTTTKYEQLTMSHLAQENVSYPNVFEDGTATHVVTAVLHGADAYFVFDREVTSDESKSQIEGEVKLTLSKLKNITVDAEASLNMNDNEKAAVEKFNCTFYGDFKLPTNPSSFKDAVKVYTDLPKMLGDNGEHAVPLKVWLYPLVKLDSRAARLQRVISNDLITYSSEMIETLNMAEMKCNDLVKEMVPRTFPAVEKKIQDLKQKCHQYKVDFMGKLGSVLPLIRGGGKEEDALVELLKSHEESPFNTSALNQWITNKEKESATVKAFLLQLQKIGADVEDKLDAILSDVSFDSVLCFTFTSLEQPDPFLSKLLNYLKPSAVMKTHEETADAQQKSLEWLTTDVRQKMRKHLKLFEDLKKSTIDSDSTKLIVASKYDENHHGACIFLYENGSDEAICFVPPSKPALPSIETLSYDSVTVKLASSCSATIERRVEYRMQQQDEWKSQTVQQSQDTVTLSGLKSNTVYEVKSAALGKLGYTERSDVITVETEKAVGPPADLRATETKSSSVNITWSTPTFQQCDFVNAYIIEYKDEQCDQWLSKRTSKEQYAFTLDRLKQNTSYAIRISTDCGDAGISEPSVQLFIKTNRTTPADLRATEIKSFSVNITWSAPTFQQCDFVNAYIIEYKEEQCDQWLSKSTLKEQYAFTLDSLKQNTSYAIRISTDCGDAGISEPSVQLLIKTNKQNHPRETKENYTLLKPGHPEIYRLNLKSERRGQFSKLNFGSPSVNPKNKTIMLLGATGTGKTTLINGMINYVLGVNWEDAWRFKLIDEVTDKTQAESQTAEVTAYQIHYTQEFQVPYSLTIIDTPGFGDTRGIKQDKAITDKIREFFSHPDGLDSIDAVCVVVQSALARLTHTQKYIFESILAIFGKDIAQNITVLITFADGQTPPVLDAIKAAEIPCCKKSDGTSLHFEFNNSALFASNEGPNSEGGNFHQMFWKMGKGSMGRFFRHLETIRTQSLQLTKEVLQERKQLEVTVEGLQPMIQVGLAQLNGIQSTRTALQQHQSCIEANKDFEYVVDVPKSDKIDIPSGTYITNCLTCNYTCHYPCEIPQDENKGGCAAITASYCTICPRKCKWDVHYNMRYKWEIKMVREQRTYANLKSRYKAAFGQKMNAEKIVQQLETEYKKVQMQVWKTVDDLAKSLRRLKEIALRPDPLTTPDYIDLLIQSEEHEAKPGYKKRIAELMEVRDNAEFLKEVAEGKSKKSKGWLI